MHILLLQLLLSVPVPIQYIPPSEGVGVSHCLILVSVPPPQVRVQTAHELQLPQPPSK